MTPELAIPFHRSIRGLALADPDAALPTPVVQPPHTAALHAVNDTRELAVQVEHAALRQALAALEEAGRQLQARDRERLAALQHAAVQLATAIASRLVHAKIAAGEFGVENLVRDLVAELGANQPTTVFLHPDDLELLRQQLGSDGQGMSERGPITFAADTTLRRGNARALAGDLTVRWRWDAKLAEIHETLVRSLDHA
jgi:flagellar biosynthesis/type III secretory pathway protein FliH